MWNRGQSGIARGRRARPSLTAPGARLACRARLAPAWQALRELFIDREPFERWLQRWRERLDACDSGQGRELSARMLRVNPRVVLRNHLGELAIRSARQGDFSVLERLQAALARPFDEVAGSDDLAGFPPDWASGISISCSS